MWIALFTVAIVSGLACTVDRPGVDGEDRAPLRVPLTPVPTASTEPDAVWVLTTPGVRVHDAPDLLATTTDTAQAGTRLSIAERRMVNGATWLRSTSPPGWVIDRPDIVIHRAVRRMDLTGGYWMLVPDDWMPVSGSPMTFTQPGKGARQSLAAQAATGAAGPASSTSSPGKRRSTDATQIAGQSAIIAVYSLNAGGYEFVASVPLPNPTLVPVFRFRQPGGSDPDTTLFRQLLASVAGPSGG